jgi:hypothetical protein
MREFFNLPYENMIIISTEDKSRDITKKSGDKITQIKPNLQDKISTKLAGMVDIVVRAVVEDDGTHTLQFKTSEVVFGGGRLKDIRNTTIPCDWDSLMDVYETTRKPAEVHTEDSEQDQTPSRRGRRKKAEVAEVDTGTGTIVGEEVTPAEPDPEPEPEKPVTRTRRTRRRTAE